MAPSCRLEDVANVTLGADDYDSQVRFDGKNAVYIGIQVAPNANLLDVSPASAPCFPSIQTQLPQGIEGKIVYDSTKFVNSSIHEVIKTLIEALLVDHPRRVRLPRLAALGVHPRHCHPAVSGQYLHGHADVRFFDQPADAAGLVLAIGLVVDDAIIVVENVNRHLEQGMTAKAAAILAARELGGPIIAMTTVLIAVFVPIGFQGGLTGALFTEFAFTLVGTVTVSAIIALTLSPMMCSRLLKPITPRTTQGWEARSCTTSTAASNGCANTIAKGLRGSLNNLPVTVVFALIVLGSIYFLFAGAKHELAPQEDQGVIITSSTAAPDSTLQQREPYAHEIYKIFASHPETDHVFQIDAPGRVIAGMVLKPWDERKKTASNLQPVVQEELNQVAGMRVASFQPPSLPGSRGLPIQCVIGTTQPFGQLNTVAQEFLQQAQKSGMFMFLDSDLRIDLPQSTVVIDRNKAALLGLSMKDIGNAMASMLGGGYVNYFSLAGRSYKVMPQVQQRFRLNAKQLLNYYIRTASGKSVPLSTVVHITTKTKPESLNHFQQLNAATIQGVALPGVTTGEALGYLKNLAATHTAARLHDRLRRPVAPVHAGIQRLHRALRVCADHHLPGPGGAVRELPRPADHPGIGAHVDRRRPDLHQPRHRRRQYQYLYRGGPGDADGPDQQARRAHRAIRQRPAARGKIQARGRRGGCQHPAAPDPDDHSRHGTRRRPADHRQRCGRGVALQYGPGDRRSGIAIGTLFTLFVVPAVYMLIAAKHAGLDESADPYTDANTTPVGHDS